MKGLQNILILGAVVAVFIVLFSFTWTKQKKARFSEVSVDIKGDDAINFIDEADVVNMLKQDGEYILGQIVDSINLEVIERRIEGNPFVKEVEAYTDLDGKFHVELTQRTPVMRIINGDKGCYIDEDGFSMPVSSAYSSKVLPVTGMTTISDAFYFNKVSVADNKTLEAVWQLVKRVNNDDFFKAQFVQADVNNHGEVILIPRVGNHQINLGKPVEIASKLENLTAFYEAGIEQSNWNIYKEIDLSFKDQIVCKKR